MSESKKQIVIVCAVSVLIALSLGAGVYYYQPKSSTSTQSVTTVTSVEDPFSTFTSAPENSTCAGVVSQSNTPSQIKTTVGVVVSQALHNMWRIVPSSNNTTGDLQVVVVALTPGVVGHLCVSYRIANKYAVVGSGSNATRYVFNPVVYNASTFTGIPLSTPDFQIYANPSLVTVPGNATGFLLVDYSLVSTRTGFYYYSLPYAEYCDNLPLVVRSPSGGNLTAADFDQITNNSMPRKYAVMSPNSASCPIPLPLTDGAIISYSNLTLSYVTIETGIQGVTSYYSSSSSATLYSTTVVTGTESATSSSQLTKPSSTEHVTSTTYSTTTTSSNGS